MIGAMIGMGAMAAGSAALGAASQSDQKIKYSYSQEQQIAQDIAKKEAANVLHGKMMAGQAEEMGATRADIDRQAMNELQKIAGQTDQKAPIIDYAAHAKFKRSEILGNKLAELSTNNWNKVTRNWATANMNYTPDVKYEAPDVGTAALVGGVSGAVTGAAGALGQKPGAVPGDVPGTTQPPSLISPPNGSMSKGFSIQGPPNDPWSNYVSLKPSY